MKAMVMNITNGQYGETSEENIRTVFHNLKEYDETYMIIREDGRIVIIGKKEDQFFLVSNHEDTVNQFFQKILQKHEMPTYTFSVKGKFRCLAICNENAIFEIADFLDKYHEYVARETVVNILRTLYLRGYKIDKVFDKLRKFSKEEIVCMFQKMENDDERVAYFLEH